MSDYEKSAFTLRFLIYYARILETDDRIFRNKRKTRKRTKAFQCFKIIEQNYSTEKVLQKKNFVNMKIVYLYYIFKFLLYRNIFDYTEIYKVQQKLFLQKSIISEINCIKKIITRI